MERLKAADNPASRFLVRLIGLWQNNHPEQYPTLHDPLAMAVAFRPNLVETQAGAVRVETGSPLTHGMTLFAPARNGAQAGTLVARDVNVRAFLDLFVERLSASPRAK